MERSDATHVGVGSALLATGLVGVTILVPLAVAAKNQPWTAPWFLALLGITASLACAGFYMLLAVYSGWWLPRTHLDRVFSPKIVLDSATARVDSGMVMLHLGLRNDGRGNVRRAVVNLVVPTFVTALHRCDVRGEQLPYGRNERGAVMPTG